MCNDGHTSPVDDPEKLTLECSGKNPSDPGSPKTYTPSKTMNETDKSELQRVAHTIRALSADAIEKAQSGHPGLPLGAAEFGAYLFMKVLRHNPRNPEWLGRDRFVLSAGHGSMLLYSLLHLCGYDLTMDDIKASGSCTSGHRGIPEVGEAPRRGNHHRAARAGSGLRCRHGDRPETGRRPFRGDLFDSKVWVLAGDGCLMEGVSSEASSLAGTLGLDNLVVMFDANKVCLDGPIDEVNLEDTAKRYEAYGFRVLRVDGYDWDGDGISLCRGPGRMKTRSFSWSTRSSVKYAPTKQGTLKAHGGPLGPEEIAGIKEAIGWTEPPFTVPDDVRATVPSAKLPGWEAQEAEWNARLEAVGAGGSGKGNPLAGLIAKRSSRTTGRISSGTRNP